MLPTTTRSLGEAGFLRGSCTHPRCVQASPACEYSSWWRKILGWEPRAQQRALSSLIKFQQQQLTLSEYFNEFKAKYGTLKALGGNLQTKQYEWVGGDGTTVKSNETVLVCLFLQGANQQEYGECLRILDNDAAKKTIRYPASLEDAYTLLDEYVKAPKKKNNNNNNNNNEEVRSYLDIDPSLPENEICLTSTKYGWMMQAPLRFSATLFF